MSTNKFSRLFRLITLLAAAALASAGGAVAADSKPAGKAEAKSPAAEDLKAVVGKINAKLQAGKRTEADLKDELAGFDTLLAKYKSEKTDDVAQILWMKAMLYSQVFEDTATARKLVQQVKTDFPTTKQAKQAEATLQGFDKADAARAIQKDLVVGKVFPDFQEKDLDGKPLSIAGYKGKVLLVDFWATWCGPCRVELPNVLATYNKHHKEGFDIVGISLDQSLDKLKDFAASNKMPWRQYFDGLGWQNKLAGKYGVNSIPATYLLDGEGKIIGRDLRGDELEKAVAAALAKK